MQMAVVRQTFDDQAVIDNRPASLARMFLDRVAETPDVEAYRFPTGDAWTSVTWAEVSRRVSRLAAGLAALGVGPEERVAVASNTRYEWILADLAIMCAGAATTTIYPSTMAVDVAFIVSDSQSRVVFAEDDEQLAKLREHRGELTGVVKVVTFDGAADGDWVLSLDELDQLGAEQLAKSPHTVAERVAAIGPDNLATLVYTSGTTGQPKGVRLLHSSWTYEGAAVAAQRDLTADDLQYLWLPLAHVFGKVLLGAQLAVGFPTAVDGRVDKIVENLAVVRPTFMGAAPRIFEKAYARIVAVAHDEGPAKAKIFDWAFRVGIQADEARFDGRRVSPLLAVQRKVADLLVFSKIRARFGGRVRFFVSGAAALSPDLARWFHAAGILILEGYGLTETAAGASVNRPDNYKLGTVGLPIAGTEFRIAGDGEILIKGPGVMAGYHALDMATAASLSEDGWFRTGDIGEIDAEGFVRITDRKKDLFKTSAGKYVAPQVIEGRFKAICPYASQFVVHGDQRNFCTAVVTLDPDALTAWAKHHGMAGMTYARIATSDAVRDMVQGYVNDLNGQLNRWETIKKFIVLDHDLSVESGELTPSMKVKRRIVEDNYRDRLDALYAG